MCKYLQAISKCVQLCACVQICSKYVQIYVKCVQNKCANPFKNHHSPGPGSPSWAAGTGSLCLAHRRWAPQVAPFSLGGLAGHIVQAWFTMLVFRTVESRAFQIRWGKNMHVTKTQYGWSENLGHLTSFTGYIGNIFIEFQYLNILSPRYAFINISLYILLVIYIFL